MIMAEFSSGDKEVNTAGVYVKAVGRSGKIKVGFSKNIDTDPDRIFVDMDELKEKDSNGNEVGKSGRTKHSFNSFATQDFTFTDVEESTLQNITVDKFSFKSSLLSGIADLTVTVYVFKENGNITLGDEENEVERGNVKFSFLLENWKFCGTSAGDVSCKKGGADETGAFIDFVITIKGKGTPRLKNENNGGKKRGQKYYLGGNSEVVMSKKVQYDGGSFTDMESGYPMIITQGSKTSFVFRLKKFMSSAFYDPTLMPHSKGVARSLFSPILSILVFVITVYLKI